jgi:hypothetical protein
MISIGSVFEGPELNDSKVRQLIMKISQHIRRERGSLNKGEIPWVNSVFVVEGSLGAPDFEYLIYGDYSKKDKGIVVQIPVLNETLNGDNLEDFLIESLHGANAMAFEFFRQKGEEFPLNEADNLVKTISNVLHN